MKTKHAAWMLVTGLLFFVSGCALSQVTAYLGLSDGDFRLEGYATAEEAAVAVEACLTQARWKVRANYQNDRVVLDGTTRSGNPFRVTITRSTNPKGESWVQAKLDMAGPEVVELKGAWTASRPDTTASTKK